MEQYRDTPIYFTEDGKAFRDGIECRYMKTNKGYVCIRPMIRGKKIYISVHRAVAEIYIPNPENKPQVNHENGDKNNNSVDNLKWMTNKENRDHAFKNGLMKVGTDYEHTKLTNDDIKYIRENYIPKHPEFSGIALSKKFGVGSSQISRIVNNTRWKHL